MHACPLSMKNKEVLGRYLIVLITKSSSFENPSPWFPAFVIDSFEMFENICVHVWVSGMITGRDWGTGGGVQVWYPPTMEMNVINKSNTREWRMEDWMLVASSICCPSCHKRETKGMGQLWKGWMTITNSPNKPTPFPLHLDLSYWWEKKNKQTKKLECIIKWKKRQGIKLCNPKPTKQNKQWK